MRCPFGFATLQRSRLRLVKKLTGEFMRVNKLDFLKENTLFRNGKSKEELLRNTTTVSTAVNRELMEKKLCFVGKLWFYQGDEQAGRSYTQIITGLIVNLFWNTILINRFFIF